MPRRRSPTPRHWAAGLGVAAASLLLGWTVATLTVSGMDPFYRVATPPGWREPRPPAIESTQAPPVTYTPIGWGSTAIAEPAQSDPPPPPAIDEYDDTALLDEFREAPLPPPEREPPPVRLDAPAPPVAVTLDAEAAFALPANDPWTSPRRDDPFGLSDPRDGGR